MAAHTPGPWRVGEKRHDYADIVIRVIRNRENHPVTMTCYAGYTRRTGDANARLIAQGIDRHLLRGRSGPAKPLTSLDIPWVPMAPWNGRER